jgi:hypothetical protein
MRLNLSRLIAYTTSPGHARIVPTLEIQPAPAALKRAAFEAFVPATG